MSTKLSLDKFGPWALITGASEGIGREFSRQLAAAGLNLMLVSRRQALLEDAGRTLAKQFGIQYRAAAADFSRDGFISALADATHDLDIGLVISNAGAPSPGKFLSLDRNTLASQLRLNALSHLDIAHHFGKRLVARGKGGLLFVGAMGAGKGAPYMGNDSAAKAYVHGLARSLHEELKPTSVHVTVLAPGPTETAALVTLGLTPETMPLKPMKVDRCVSEALRALQTNQPLIIPGRMNRLMNALVPDSVTRNMMGKLFSKSQSHKPALQHAQPTA